MITPQLGRGSAPGRGSNNLTATATATSAADAGPSAHAGGWRALKHLTPHAARITPPRPFPPSPRWLRASRGGSAGSPTSAAGALPPGALAHPAAARPHRSALAAGLAAAMGRRRANGGSGGGLGGGGSTSGQGQSGSGASGVLPRCSGRVAALAAPAEAPASSSAFSPRGAPAGLGGARGLVQGSVPPDAFAPAPSGFAQGSRLGPSGPGGRGLATLDLGGSRLTLGRSTPLAGAAAGAKAAAGGVEVTVEAARASAESREAVGSAGWHSGGLRSAGASGRRPWSSDGGGAAAAAGVGARARGHEEEDGEEQAEGCGGAVVVRSPADLTRAIKACASPAALRRLYLRHRHTGAAGTAQQHAVQQHAVQHHAVQQHVVAFNDLHLVAALSHLAQLAARDPQTAAAVPRPRPATAAAAAAAAAAARGGARAGSRNLDPNGIQAVSEAAALGHELAAEVAARLAAGSAVLSQPRAASNALWAAAKLGLRLRPAWWQAVAAPLLRGPVGPAKGPRGQEPKAAPPAVPSGRTSVFAKSSSTGSGAAAGAGAGAGAGAAPQLPSGRDLSNALYALGVAAEAAAAVGGDSTALPYRRVRRLRDLGGRLLGVCTHERLRGCNGQELAALLYGVALLQLSPPAGWLAGAFGPAWEAAAGSAGPQAVANTLWALQELASAGAAGASGGEGEGEDGVEPAPGPAVGAAVRVPPRLAAALLARSRELLAATQLEGAAADAGGGVQSAAEARTEDSGFAARSSPFANGHAGPRRAQLRPSEAQAQAQAQPKGLAPDLLATVVWSVGRLSDMGAFRPGPDDPGLSASGSGSGSGSGPGAGWLREATAAVRRTLRRRLGEREAGHGTGQGQAAGRAGALGPRALASLASGLAQLQVRPSRPIPGAAGQPGEDVWTLLYATALRLCAPAPATASGYGTQYGSTQYGAPTPRSLHWDARDIFAVLSAAVTTTELGPVALASAGAEGEEAAAASPAGGDVGRPPPALMAALLRQLTWTVLPPGTRIPIPVAAGLGPEDLGPLLSGNGRGGAQAGPDPGSGPWGPALDDAFVGSVWAIARLRYQPSPESLALLAAACRSRLARMRPQRLSQLLWALARLSRHPPLLALPGSGGLAGRIREALERLCAPLGGPAAAAAAASSASGFGSGSGSGPASAAVAASKGLGLESGSAVGGAVSRGEAEGAEDDGDDEAGPGLEEEGEGATAAALSPRATLQLLYAVRQLGVPLPPAVVARVAAALAAPAARRLRRRMLRLAAATKAEARAGARDLAECTRQLGGLSSALGAIASASALAAAAASVRPWAGGGARGRGRGGAQHVLRPRLRLRAVPSVLRALPGLAARGGVRSALWQAGWAALRASAASDTVRGTAAEAGTVPAGVGMQGAVASDQQLGEAGDVPWICAYLVGLRKMGLQPPPRLAAALVRHLTRPGGPLGPGGAQQPLTCRELVGLSCELSHLLQHTPAAAAAAADATASARGSLRFAHAGRRLRRRSNAAAAAARQTAAADDGAPWGMRPHVAAAVVRAVPTALAARRRSGGAGGGGGVSAQEATTLLAAIRRLQGQPTAATVTALLTATADGGGGLAAAGLADAAALAAAVAAAAPTVDAAAAARWLAALAEVAEARLAEAASTPAALLESELPAVGVLLAASDRAPWMRPVVQERVLPAAFAACVRTLAGGAPLPYIVRMLDELLLLVTRPTPAPTTPTTAATAGGNDPSDALLPPLEVAIPDAVWLAVYRSSFRQIATAMPYAVTAAAAAAATAPGGSSAGAAGRASIASGSDSGTDEESDLARAAGGGGGRTAALQPPRRPDSAVPAATATAASASAAAAVGAVRNPRGTGWAPVGPVLTGRQLVSLAYALARHPPPRPPPDRWMRLLLTAVESELGSLGARECADLCVALVRLGSVPGGPWLARFSKQVELSRALTEKTEHELLSAAWLGLRRWREAAGRGGAGAGAGLPGGMA